MAVVGEGRAEERERFRHRSEQQQTDGQTEQESRFCGVYDDTSIYEIRKVSLDISLLTSLAILETITSTCRYLFCVLIELKCR